MKRTALALLLAPLFSGAVMAASYTGPSDSPQVSDVAGAMTAVDDTPVVLQGQIVKRLRHEQYLFKDATGTIEVEIDDDEWPQGQEVSETATVRITGEVDVHHERRDIDVERIELVK